MAHKNKITATRIVSKEEQGEHVPERVRCFEIEFKGKVGRFNESPDLAFMELNDFFVERDHVGPFLRVITEKGHYRIRLEREYRLKRQSVE